MKEEGRKKERKKEERNEQTNKRTNERGKGEIAKFVSQHKKTSPKSGQYLIPPRCDGVPIGAAGFFDMPILDIAGETKIEAKKKLN